MQRHSRDLKRRSSINAPGSKYCVHGTHYRPIGDTRPRITHLTASAWVSPKPTNATPTAAGGGRGAAPPPGAGARAAPPPRPRGGRGGARPRGGGNRRPKTTPTPAGEATKRKKKRNTPPGRPRGGQGGGGRAGGAGGF